MKAFNGFKAEPPVRKEKLPAGGYVAKILDAKEVSYDWGSVLLISFDIVEGDYKDFFRKDYAGQQQEDKKWRGVFRLPIPKDDGSERDGWTKNSFNHTMFAVEDSNPGYHWDWNESGLKGKTTGLLYRDREWEMNGNTGWTTECCAFISATDIREKKFEFPKKKPLAKRPVNINVDFEPVADDEDLPF